MGQKKQYGVSAAALLVLSLCVAVMTASGASAAKVRALELKEEGVPVAAGAEALMVLQDDFCGVREWAQVSVNGAKKDEVGVDGSLVLVSCGFEHWGLYRSGTVKKIAMSGAGKATLKTTLRFWWERAFEGKPRECIYEFRKFSGTFPIPGLAVIEAVAAGNLVPSESSHTGCPRSEPNQFRVTLRGHNEKPLETELVG